MSRTLIVLSLLTGLGCAETASAQFSVSDSDLIWIDPPLTQVAVGPAHIQFDVAVMVDFSTVLGAITIPLTYGGAPGLNIDTNVIAAEPPGPGGIVVGVTFGPAGRDASWSWKSSYIDTTVPGILLGFVSFTQFEPAADTLCYVHFDVSPGTSGSVPLDSGVVNFQRLALVTPDAFEFRPTWTSGLLQIIDGAGLPGDLDCDNEVTVGDIILLVNFIFKDGPEPCSPAAADVDCDGQLILNDVIWLVNYLFRGGPAPIPPCD